MSNIQGTLHAVGATQQVKDNFLKRDFVIKVDNQGANGIVYSDFITFQLTQTKCGIIDVFKIGDKVDVHYNLRGREYTKDGPTRYFNTIEAWKVLNANQQQQPQAPYQPAQNQQYAPQPQQQYQAPQQGQFQGQQPQYQGNNDLPF